ncbi:MAG: ABC transporter permease [Acidobacteriota bacterium]
MTVRVAFKALARNKLRTALTMLGMIIGVAAVIAMVALGTGAQAAIEAQVRANGTNLISIAAGGTNQGGVRTGAGGSTRLVPADAQMLRELPEIQWVAENSEVRTQLINGNQNWNTRVVGTNVDLPSIRSWPVRFGAFFSEDDVKSATRVLVLGSNVATTLFGEGVDPTDAVIRVRNQVFRVVGVMAPKGSAQGGVNMDDQVLAPYTTVMKKMLGIQYLEDIYVSAVSADQLSQAADAVTLALRTAHGTSPGQDDFTVRTVDDIVALRTQTSATLTNLLAGIAGVSLVVGGIGIMNIMLVSVTERTREIGLRLAIGARGSDVLAQFLVEAVAISFVGGAIGIAAGYGIAAFLSYYQGAPALVPVNAVLVAVLFSGFVGIFFGFYPARKAAALDPIDALRFE